MTLIERIEAGTREEQIGLLEEAWRELPRADGWTVDQDRDFFLMLAIGTDEACAGAAMMLKPEGWSIGLGDLRGYTPIVWRAHIRDHRPHRLTKAGHSQYWFEGHAATPALALAAACLKAQGADHE